MPGAYPTQTGVCLQEITFETVRAICKLSDTLSTDQRKMVADNAVSIAEAHFCDKAWFRAVCKGDEPVGFVMLYMGNTGGEDGDEGVYLWRFMIAGSHQGKGYGRQVIEIIKDHLRALGVNQLKTSIVIIKGGGAEGFYRKLGFTATGEIVDGEAVMLLKF
jgi:diamine N-acetyltransferase